MWSSSNWYSDSFKTVKKSEGELARGQILFDGDAWQLVTVFTKVVAAKSSQLLLQKVVIDVIV